MTVCHDFLFSILCHFLSSHSERVTLNSSPQTSVNQSDAHLPAQALMHRLESSCMLGRLHARSQRSQWRWGVVWGLPSVAPGFRRRDNGRNVIDPSSSLEKDKTAQQTGEWLALGLVLEGTHWLLPPESLLTDKARWCGSLQAEADWGPLSYPPPHLFDLCLLPCLWLNLFGNHITSAAPANDIFAPPNFFLHAHWLKSPPLLIPWHWFNAQHCLQITFLCWWYREVSIREQVRTAFCKGEEVVTMSSAYCYRQKKRKGRGWCLN